jgi:hypothetical protein
MTIAMVPSITSARVAACNVGTSGMGVATVLGVGSTLVNVRAGMTITMVPSITSAHAVIIRCRSANQVRVVVTGTDGSTPGTVTIPAIVTRARVVISYVVVTSSVCITTVIIIVTLVDIVAPGTNQFVMWTVTRAALIVGSACCLSSELSMFARAGPAHA